MPCPPSPLLIGAALNDWVQAYLQEIANQLSYADAAEALGYKRGSFNSLKALYADYNVTPPHRKNQHSAVGAPDGSGDLNVPRVEWVPLNRAERRKTGLERGIVISDIHVPFHDERAVSVALAMVAEMQPDFIVIGGDLCDFYAISKYVKDPLRKLQLNDELEACRGFLVQLREAAGEDCDIIFVQGNHEQRLEDYILKNAPSLADLPELSIEHLLRLDDLSISYIRGKGQTKTAYYQYGDIRVGHFDSLAPKSGYLAHRLMDKWRSPVIQGHSHRLALVTYTDPNGHLFVGAESGCLASLDAEYVDAPNWAQGLVVITRELESQRDHLEVVPIVNGSALYDSVLYTA